MLVFSDISDITKNLLMVSTKTGMWTALLGALLILLGIVVLAMGNFYGWHYGSASTVGWVEIILSLIAMALAYYYKSNKGLVGWSIVILALITMPFNGGFWLIGAILALIGGIIIATAKE
jgi:hypothetical protein